jgi:hypothetical protein
MEGFTKGHDFYCECSKCEAGRSKCEAVRSQEYGNRPLQELCNVAAHDDVDEIREEIAALKTENAELREKIETLTKMLSGHSNNLRYLSSGHSAVNYSNAVKFCPGCERAVYYCVCPE